MLSVKTQRWDRGERDEKHRGQAQEDREFHKERQRKTKVLT